MRPVAAMDNGGYYRALRNGAGMKDVLKRIGRSWIGYYGTGMMILILVFTGLNPSASEGLGVLDRTLFWTAHIGSGLLILILCQSVLSRSHLLESEPTWVRVAMAGALGALVFTPVALGLDQAFPDFDPDPEEAGSLLAMMAEEFSNFVVPFTGSWLLLNTPKLMEATHSHLPDNDGQSKIVEETTDAGSPPPSPERSQSFVSRLPTRLGSDIVALSAELHYLRVHTVLGETLILYSFGQAVADMESMNTVGMKVHRSHWVALDHVLALEKQGERLLCVLPGSLRFPVSRPYRPGLRAALQTRLN
jgi:hypothetical protein